MTHRHDIRNALKAEAAHLFGPCAEELQEASRQKAKGIAADVKTFLSDFRDAITLEEEEIARAFAGRAATTLATALALGIVIGWAMRKKS